MSRESDPLLPRYEDQGDHPPLGQRLQPKLRTYEALRALSQGYMPSNDQIIFNLRRLLALDLLNARHPDIGTAGRQIIRDLRRCIKVLIDFLHEKNADDRLQEFLWRLARSRAAVDTERVSWRASNARARVDTGAAYDSLHTIGSLLLVNADFRLFVQDVTTVGRQIFSDTALSVSEASHQVGEELKPSQERANAVQGAAADDQDHGPSNEDLRQDASQVAETAERGISRTEQDAVASAKEHLGGQTRGTLLYRLKQVVANLRQQSNYSDSVAIVTQLVRQYARAYGRAAQEASAAAEEDVGINADLKEAVHQFWLLVQTVGDVGIWKDVQDKFEVLIQHAQGDPEFENLVTEIGKSLQQMLTDPDFFDTAPQKLDELTQKTKNLGTESSLGQDIVAFLIQANRAVEAVAEDPAVRQLTDATTKLCEHAYDEFRNRESDLPTDLVQVFFPILVRYIQYIPILRLEIAAPEMDLLVENLILEPGRTVHYSSFLPFRTHVTTRNDINILKKHAKRTATDIKTTFTATVHGLNISSSEFGYWVRTHTGIFRLKDEGFASFYLDRRGIDISLDVEVGRNRLDHIFTLTGVRVVIHKLDYKIHRGKWRFLLWLAKPFLKHMVRRVLEKNIAEQIVAASNALNRELIFARERLRAARVSNPRDLVSFVRAVLARMQPAPSDSDIEAGIGMDVAGHGIFKDVYAPGSTIKAWQDEMQLAQEDIDEGDESGGFGTTWRNDIFDVPGRSLE